MFVGEIEKKNKKKDIAVGKFITYGLLEDIRRN